MYKENVPPRRPSKVGLIGSDANAKNKQSHRQMVDGRQCTQSQLITPTLTNNARACGYHNVRNRCSYYGTLGNRVTSQISWLFFVSCALKRRSTASKALALALMLLTRKTTTQTSVSTSPRFTQWSGGCRLTAWEDHPDEVEEKVVSPKIVSLRSEVGDAFEPVVEETGGIVEQETI